MFFASHMIYGQQHPSLILRNEGVVAIRTGKAAPLFEKAIEDATNQVEAAIKQGIDVPIPKDMAGGYTHEQHKRNYSNMNLAGALYQIQEEDRYADFVRDMLLEYAELFPSLPLHPADKSYARGKLFWQCLNDANWIVYTSQAYDCIYDYLSEDDRKKLEEQLFRPYADFISIENPRFFNRVHNHSTWGNAAVGMIGIVMQDEELIQRALYGLQLANKDLDAKDNDGGYIYEKGKSKAGFFAQIDHAFSPDGYYTEGPYYQRYAMTPFMLFAQALDNYNPDLQIFAYRDSLLIKAVYALLNQTNQAGEFFPINDAQKGMSFLAKSVISTVDIAFGKTKDYQLADIARQQGHVSLDQNGYAIALAISDKSYQTFDKKSVLLRDGADGTAGALAILRAKNASGGITVPFKCTAQGLGHGHYDKLSYTFYDEETEVLQDYGAARWVNIDQKDGGRYLKENNTWAKQSIAHNTLVVDETSHFGGKYNIANLHHSDIVSYDFRDENLQIISAKEVNAYKNVQLYRTIILWNNEQFRKPILIDLATATSEGLHQFDLPYHYAGQILQTNVDYQITQPPSVLGQGHGYQHIYQEASGKISGSILKFNWLKDRKFYTLTTLADEGDEAILARIGANDPNFNLRRDPFLIHRKEQAENPVFLTVLESHGKYNPVSEIPNGPYSQIASLELMYHDQDYTFFSVISTSKEKWLFMLYHGASNDQGNHQKEVGGVTYEWKGLINMIKQ